MENVMGWTSIPRKLTEQEKREIIFEDFNYQKQDGDVITKVSVLDYSKKGNVYYFAYQIITQNVIDTFHKSVKVIAGVALTENKKDGFYYKIMDETVGPYYYDCPEKILKLLTKPENEHSANWRKECRKMHSKHKIVKGTMVKFKEPIKFNNGHLQSEFIFESHSTFWANGMKYRVSGWKNRDFEIIE